MADVPTKYIKGAAQTVINTAANIAAGNFSGSPAATFTNNDATVPAAPYALAMLEMPDWGGAPGNAAVVQLWGVLKKTDGASEHDTDAPSGTSPGGAWFFGSWLVASVDALQRRTIRIDIKGFDEIDFYIWNLTSQQMTNNGGTNCVLKITPFADGFAA